MRRALLALAVLALLPSQAQAGGDQVIPVKISVSQPDLRPGETNTARLTLDIAADRWLHAREEVSAEPVTWTVGDAPPGLTVGPTSLPEPVDRDGQPVYRGVVVFELPLTPAKDAGLGKVSLTTILRWQTCTATGCGSPQTQEIVLTPKILPPLGATR